MPTETPLHLFLRRLRHRAGCSPETALSDAQLVERFAATRDEAAFELLVWRHGALVLNLCRRLLHHEQDAEDAFQATFLTLARKAGSIRKRKAVASWLYKVAYRICLAARYAAARRPAQERTRPEELPAPACDDALWRELRSILDEEVQRLPEKYRAAFLLCHLEGKTNEEAAELLGCPKGTVLSRLARARERLRGRLTRRGITVSAAALGALVSEQASANTVSARLVHPTVKTALAVAAGQTITSAASPSVAELTEGAIRAMFFHKFKVAAAVLLTAGVFAAGVAGTWAIATRPDAATDDKAADQSAIPSASQEPEDALQAARLRLQTRKKLSGIIDGLYKYADKNGGLLPPPALIDKNGIRLLSWRVLILPYVGEEKLYEQFHRDEPWESEHNKKLLGKMPAIFSSPGAGDTEKGKTSYLAVVGPGAAFEKGKQMRFPADFLDGTAQTIAIIEAENSVPWTKPEDLNYDPAKALTIPSRNFYAALMDGVATLISKDADETELKNMITRAGGEVINNDKVLADTVAPKDVKASAQELRRANHELRKALASAQEELQKVQDEQDGINGKTSGKDAAALENAKLRRRLDQIFDKIEEIRREIEQKKKQHKQR